MNHFYFLNLFIIIFLSFFSTLVFSAFPDGPPDSSSKKKRPIFNKPSIPSVNFSSLNHLGIERTGVNLKSLMEGLEAKLIYDPVISVNKNRGDLKTLFNIPLPPHLLSLSGLQFNYSSQDSRNNSFGK